MFYLIAKLGAQTLYYGYGGWWDHKHEAQELTKEQAGTHKMIAESVDNRVAKEAVFDIVPTVSVQ